MRSILSFLTLSIWLRNTFSNIPLMDKFENWVQRFHIEFRNKHHLYDTLRKWMVNDEYIDIVNKNNRTYSLGHNQFSGMDEFDFIKFVHD
jgi:hypothetical protein